MTLEIKHAVQVDPLVWPDNPAVPVGTEEWNQSLVATMENGFILGRVSEDAGPVEELTAEQVKGLLGLAEAVKADESANLTAGYTATSDADGTISGGTYMPDPATGNFKRLTNDGAFTFAAPTAANDYTMVVKITNGTSAGEVTFSGFNVVTGDDLTTTDGHKFFVYITKIDGDEHANVVALQ